MQLKRPGLQQELVKAMMEEEDIRDLMLRESGDLVRRCTHACMGACTHAWEHTCMGAWGFTQRQRGRGW